MNIPKVIVGTSFQDAWSKAILELESNQWDMWDLVVRINDPKAKDISFHEQISCFARDNELVPPNQVAYTIFPYKLARSGRSFEKICGAYLSKFYPMTRHMEHSGWGTYFHRMICYPSVKQNKIIHVNQLGKIITAIKESKNVNKVAYTMVICRPGGENVKPLGTPCLNTIAIKQEPISGTRRVTLLAVYRNHDFKQRAYGNYQGLCALLSYIACETNSLIGNVTCISSHAYLNTATRKHKDFLLQSAEHMLEGDNSD